MLVYLTLFFVGLVFVVLSGVLGDLFGGGDEITAGSDGDMGGGDVPSPFSPRILAAGATGFGAGGGISLILGVPDGVSVLFALGGLFAVGGVVYLFLMGLARAQGSTHTLLQTLIGLQGTGVTRVSPGGVGEVTVLAQGQSMVYLARTNGSEGLQPGQTVSVIGLAGESLLVAPVVSMN
ncbi:MAG: hypothetical protein EXR52_05760 [Dehalococcoidia bacterium]|nr:hypothetical protein [Dehalococcoidia bacterium]